MTEEYEIFYREADARFAKLENGLSVFDVIGYALYQAWENGKTPQQAAEEASLFLHSEAYRLQRDGYAAAMGYDTDDE